MMSFEHDSGAANPLELRGSFAGALVGKGRSFTSPGRLIRIVASREAIAVSVEILSYSFCERSIPSSTVTSVQRCHAGSVSGWIVSNTADASLTRVYLWDADDTSFGRQMEGLGYPVIFEPREISRRTLQ